MGPPTRDQHRMTREHRRKRVNPCSLVLASTIDDTVIEQRDGSYMLVMRDYAHMASDGDTKMSCDSIEYSRNGVYRFVYVHKFVLEDYPSML